MASHSPGESPLRPPASAGMVERIKRLLIDPRGEWARIDAEPMPAATVFRAWAVPLAAIGPIAGLIGGQVFGYGGFGFSFRPSLGASIGGALLGYVLSLIGVWVLTLIIVALAPTFGATANRDQAMKVAAFSYTAAWLAGVFKIIPTLGFLALAGLYSFYLLWIGLPMLMKAPTEKAAGYVGASIVVSIVVYAVTAAITGAIVASIAAPMTLASSGGGGTVTVPGVGTIDTGKMEAAAARMSALSAKMEADARSGKPASVTPPATLQAMLPASIGGWTRGDVESESAGAGGVGGSRASAKYTMGGDTMTLSVADIGAMGAIAGLAGAMNVQSSKQTASGYEKTETIDGRIVNAKWNGGDRTGSYDIVVGNRFTVSAQGNAPGDAAFKTVVDAIDLGRLEAMAKE